MGVFITLTLIYKRPYLFLGGYAYSERLFFAYFFLNYSYIAFLDGEMLCFNRINCKR